MTRKRKLLALFIAVFADFFAQSLLFPLVVEGGFSPVEWALDLATAIALSLVVGFKPRIVVAFLLELVPLFSIFPSWTALVVSLPVDDAAAPRSPEPKPGRVIDVRPVVEGVEGDEGRKP